MDFRRRRRRKKKEPFVSKSVAVTYLPNNGL